MHIYIIYIKNTILGQNFFKRTQNSQIIKENATKFYIYEICITYIYIYTYMIELKYRHSYNDIQTKEKNKTSIWR